MFLRSIDTKPAPVGGSPTDAGLSLDFGLEGQVQGALNLFLTLKNPAQMGALLGLLDEAQDTVHDALSSLHYVHFARFLPTRDCSTLMVITAYDGDLESYILDFVGVLGDQFTAILQFVKDAPPLPVQNYPREFIEFVLANNLSKVGVWSAYPEATVIDILRNTQWL